MNRLVRERDGRFRVINGRGQVAIEQYRKWEIRAHRQIQPVNIGGVRAKQTRLVYIGHIDAYGYKFGTMTYPFPGMVRASIDGWWEQMQFRMGWKESDIP